MAKMKENHFPITEAEAKLEEANTLVRNGKHRQAQILCNQ
jgi:hypothetical protein